MSEYIKKLIEYTQLMMQNVSEMDPSTVDSFKIVAKVLNLIRRMDILFLELKRPISNMLKLDEAEKIKDSLFKMLTKLISKVLSKSMQNLFVSVNFVYKRLHKKFKKKKLKEYETCSQLAFHITEYLKSYMGVVDEYFTTEQKDSILRIIVLEFIKFLEMEIPTQQKYSESDLITLNMDMEQYQQLVDQTGDEEVERNMLELKSLVNLLTVPWQHIEQCLEENDLYKEIDRELLESFVRCCRRINN